MLCESTGSATFIAGPSHVVTLALNVAEIELGLVVRGVESGADFGAAVVEDQGVVAALAHDQRYTKNGKRVVKDVLDNAFPQMELNGSAKLLIMILVPNPQKTPP